MGPPLLRTAGCALALLLQPHILRPPHALQPLQPHWSEGLARPSGALPFMGNHFLDSPLTELLASSSPHSRSARHLLSKASSGHSTYKDRPYQPHASSPHFPDFFSPKRFPSHTPCGVHTSVHCLHPLWSGGQEELVTAVWSTEPRLPPSQCWCRFIAWKPCLSLMAS